MEENKDFWSRLEVVSKIIGAILIPLTIFLVGQKFNKEKEIANRNQRDFQNTIELLKLCNSENDELRLSGFNYAEYLQRKKLLDEELIPILSRVQSEEKNSETAIKTGEVFEKIKSNINENTTVNDLDSDLVTRVYFHINQDNQRDNANRLKRFLESKGNGFRNGLNIPGIELKEYSFQISQLRVFKKDEIELANKIADVVAEFGGISIEVVDLSNRYPNSSIRPRHFEIWLGNDFK